MQSVRDILADKRGSMIRQENCPYCDWKIEWTQVKTDGKTKICPHCDTRLVGDANDTIRM